MAKNSFQRMEDENLNNRSSEQIERVRQNVDGSVSFIQMVGKIIEVYLPRVFDVFVMMGGGKEREDTNVKENQPPSDGGSDDFRRGGGPSSPDFH